MDAEGAEDVRHRMRTAKTCGPDASTVGVKLGLSPPATVSTKPDHRGDYEATVNHCVRSAGLFRCICGDYSGWLFFCRPGCGCIVHPAFPRPFEGETLKIKPRAKKHAARSRSCVCIRRHCEERKRRRNPAFLL